MNLQRNSNTSISTVDVTGSDKKSRHAKSISDGSQPRKCPHADGLTKALTRQNHEKFVDMIGLKDIGTEIFTHQDFMVSLV